MTFMVTVIAGAGILCIIASRALAEVKVELFDHALFTGSRLDLVVK